jgi:alpha-ribazole phosphatase
MKLTLIRHGITEGNRRNLYYGWTDIPLLPEGRAALAENRRTRYYPTAAHYYTSGLRRTEETFQILYPNTPHTVISDLREMNFGAFEMREEQELKTDPLFQRWSTGNVTENVCPGGESFLHLQQRALRAIAPILAQDEDTVCVIHGGVITVLMNAWFPGQTNPYAFAPQPGTGYQIEVEHGHPVSYHAIPAEQAENNGEVV